VQTAAGVTGVNASAGVTGSIGNGLLTLSGDTTYLQRRVTGTCATGSAVATVNADGTVTCQAVTGGGGSLTLPVILSGSVAPPGANFTITQTATGPTPPQNDPPPSFFDTVPASIVGIGAGASGVTVGVVGKGTGPASIGMVATNSGSDIPALVVWSTNSGKGNGGNFIIEGTDGYALEADAKATSGFTKAMGAYVNSPNGTALEIDVPAVSTAYIINSNGFQVDGTGKLMANSAILNGSMSINGPTVVNGTFSASSATLGNSLTVGSMTVGSINTFSSCNTPPCQLGLNASVNVSGSLNVNGTLTKASGSFKIDHPLDPANKYLYHSFVESPDMMNVYNGVVALDARGQAWIQLPDYFEALNQDFRYQLTSIGRFMPVYIAREISGNRFRIAGGKPHGKVSWQVTGIRHDAYASAHRIPVEVEKPQQERGTYLAPELFAHPGASVAKTDAGAKNAPASPGGENK
jgi:hypothetical protein